MNKGPRSLVGAAAIVLIALFATAASANVKGRVQASLAENGELWQGQQITVHFDLETTGFSFTDVHLQLPDVPGAILMQTDTTTIKLTERRNGETWQILRYPLALYPQRPGLITVPPLSARFSSSASFGSEERTFDLRGESLTLTVQRPPGLAPGTSVISSEAFELNYQREPEKASFEAGDAVRLRLTRKARDISGMFFDPLPPADMEGVSVYSAAPRIEDEVVRGALTGVRTDEMTWLFEQPGQYQLPGFSFEWWDPQSGQLKQSTIPPLTAEVTSGPASGAALAPSPSREDWISYLALAATLCLAALLWRFRIPLTIRRGGRDRLKLVIKACQSNDALRAYQGLARWVTESPATASRAGGKHIRTPTEFARSLGRKDFADAIEELQLSLIGENTEWRGTQLAAILQAVNKEFNHGHARSRQYDLPNFNPR